MLIPTDLLKAALFCASTEETRYYLKGVHLSTSGHMVTTDGHRLFCAKLPDQPAADVIIPLADVQAALKHADASAELSRNFTKLHSSSDDFKGFPSSMIEGSYDLGQKRLHSYNRVVIPVTPAPRFERYLVQLTITTMADQAAARKPKA